MAIFDATRTYDHRHDVRRHDDLVGLLQGSWPNGTFWPLVAARRMGKTWTLQGVRHQMGTASVQFLDLRHGGAAFDAGTEGHLPADRRAGGPAQVRTRPRPRSWAGSTSSATRTRRSCWP